MTKETDCCATEPTTAQTSATSTTAGRIRSWVRSPQGLTATGIGVVAISLALNWGWVVAVGAAPLILAVAPCAGMCALGLCMNMRGHPNRPVRPAPDGAARASDLTPTRADRVPW